jgi:hypothetical protein
VEDFEVKMAWTTDEGSRIVQTPNARFSAVAEAMASMKIRRPAMVMPVDSGREHHTPCNLQQCEARRSRRCFVIAFFRYSAITWAEHEAKGCESRAQSTIPKENREGYMPSLPSSRSLPSVNREGRR